MKEIEFQTDFPCLIITETENGLLSPGDNLLMSGVEFFISPLIPNLPPFSINVSDNIGKNFRLISHENKNLCFLFALQALHKKVIEKQKIAGMNLQIEISSSDVTYTTETQKIVCPVDFSPKEFSCKVIANFSAVILTKASTSKLLLFNPKTNLFKIYKGKDFEVSTNKITFTQTFQDFAASTIDKVLNFEKDSFQEEIISSNISAYHLLPQTICFAFLDCVLQENYSLAKRLLANNFENISHEKFKDFFGKERFYEENKLSNSNCMLVVL